MDSLFENKKFFNGYLPFHQPTYTVVIVYLSGRRKEVPSIDNPWKYISKVKKDPTVSAVWIQS